MCNVLGPRDADPLQTQAIGVAAVALGQSFEGPRLLALAVGSAEATATADAESPVSTGWDDRLHMGKYAERQQQQQQHHPHKHRKGPKRR
jgi:hypothetical protein